MARGKKGEAAAPKGGKGKGPKPVAAEGAPPKTLQAQAMTSARKLNSLLADSRKAYKEQRSISGELGAAIKEAAEHDNLHKKAFATVRGLDRMEPEKLADFFAHFDYYCEATGLRKRAGAVMRMPLGDDGLADGEQPGAAGATVTPFPAPRGEAAE